MSVVSDFLLVSFFAFSFFFSSFLCVFFVVVAVLFAFFASSFFPLTYMGLDSDTAVNALGCDEPDGGPYARMHVYSNRAALSITKLYSCYGLTCTRARDVSVP